MSREISDRDMCGWTLETIFVSLLSQATLNTVKTITVLKINMSILTSDCRSKTLVGASRNVRIFLFYLKTFCCDDACNIPYAVFHVRT
jgi:hypothetical protein